MAAFCHFYGCTPEQYRALTVRDHAAMCVYMDEYIRAQGR